MFTGIFERGVLDGTFALVIAIGGVLAILLTIAYSFGAARRIFFGPLSPALENKDISDPRWTMTVPLLVVAAASVLLGMYPRLVMDLLHGVIAAS